MRRAMAAVLAALLVALGAAACAPQAKNTAPPAQKQTEQSSAAPAGVRVGQVMQPFTLTDLAGKKVEVKAAGKPLVLNFWATWCPPCRAEMPEMDAFAKKHGDAIVFYAVNLQESPQEVKDFLQQNGYTLPVLRDDGTVARLYQVRAIPTTLIVDGKGVIQVRKTGAATTEELEKSLEGLQ